jgi:hypothetical protein
MSQVRMCLFQALLAPSITRPSCFVGGRAAHRLPGVSTSNYERHNHPRKTVLLASHWVLELKKNLSQNGYGPSTIML